MRLMRPVCLLVALAASAWFAIGIRDTQSTDQAAAILSASPHPTASAARRVNSLLDAASLLNPDRQVQLLRGQLELQLGHRAVAQRIFQRVVAEEPQNILAWGWLRQAAKPGSRAAEAAYFHELALDPPVR